MKKVAAILLIALFVFNLVGYRMLINYAQQQSDVRLEASIDKDQYNQADLLTIKVPLSLPYLNDQVNFERVNGEITVNGKIYKYVKRKVSNGNLVLLCLPDQDKMLLQTAKNDFFKYANDLVQNNQSKKSGHSKDGVFKNLVSEFLPNSFAETTNYYIPLLSHNIARQLNNLPSAPHASPEQPPELF